MNAQAQALVYRFLLGLIITEIPVATAVLASATPDYRLLAIGLLGGLATAIEKYIAPQLASTILPNAVILPDTKPTAGPTVASALRPPHG